MVTTRHRPETIWNRYNFPISMEGCVLYLPLWQEDMRTSILSYDQYHSVGTVVGAIWTPQGRTFAGDDKITIADNDALDVGTGDFSVGAWCNLTTDVTDDRAIMWKQPDNSPAGTYAGWLIRFLATTGYFSGGIDERPNGADYLYSNDTTDHLNTGWHLYFMTVDRDSATGFNLWVDAVVVKTADPTAVALSCSNAVPLYVGVFRTGTGSAWYKGGMEELFLYKGKALNLSEMTNLYLATKGRYKV